MSQNRYNQYFKQIVVELYLSQKPVSQISNEYGVSRVTIYNWIKHYSKVKVIKELTVAEVNGLQKENYRLQRELEILKNAITILSRN